MVLSLSDIERAEESLWKSSVSIGLEYLKTRGLEDDTIRAFRLGLVKRKEDERFWIVIPFLDSVGNLVGVQFRLIGERGKAPRYLFPKSFNGTPFSVKTKVFGVYQSLSRMLDERRCYVTEGAFDAMSLYQAGLPAVSTLSANFSSHAYFYLIRYVDDIILVRDGDEAGEKHLREFEKVCESFKNITKATFSKVNIPDLFPNCKDANEALCAFGKEELCRRIVERVCGII